MKFGSLMLSAAVIHTVAGSEIQEALTVAHNSNSIAESFQTTVPTQTSSGSVEASITSAPESLITAAPLEKRAKGVLINPQYKAEQEAKANGGSSSKAKMVPWVRTIYETVVEIVTPTVIGDVTFAAKPPATTNGLELWISLDNVGLPKTIKPELKNGHIKKPSPTYDTYFATATTITYNKEQLKAHNMAEDQVHSEVEWIDEDTTYRRLNPIIRCTPARYKKKGLAKDTLSEPFCTPEDNKLLKIGKTYFVTWYSRFFSDEVQKVRLHVSLVEEAAKQKGFRKRSAIIEQGGKLTGTVFSSDWIDKDEGYFPLQILEEWIGDKSYTKRALLTLQPDNVPDDEFDLLDKYVIIDMSKGNKVSKGTHLDLKALEEKQRNRQLGIEVEEGISEKYMIMMLMPTCVILAALGMYFFVFINKGSTDLSHLKRRKAAGKNTTHKMIPWTKKKNTSGGGYSMLPLNQKDVELENVGKKD